MQACEIFNNIWESWLFHQLESSASTDLLGWVVASYSIGQLIASPFFGMMANCMRKSREPLVISLIINILANILYAYLEDIKTHRVVFLIAARALIGFGAGKLLFIHVLLFCVFSMYSPVSWLPFSSFNLKILLLSHISVGSLFQDNWYTDTLNIITTFYRILNKKNCPSLTPWLLLDFVSIMADLLVINNFWL